MDQKVPAGAQGETSESIDGNGAPYKQECPDDPKWTLPVLDSLVSENAIGRYGR